MNVKIELQFDGTDYHGWQIQSGVPTVQGELRRAIHAVTGEDIMPIGCGRTDAGVHAASYIASFVTASNIPIERLPYALNAQLAPGIICRGAETVPDSFNAARSAKGKTYRYIIDNGEFPDMFSARFSWHYRYALDADAMADAARAFIGTHDFIGFAASGFSVKTTVRTIHRINVERSGNIITTDITGNGFLYNMVRIIAGTLVDVGCGRTAASALPDIILSGDRKRAGATAPAHGLCLKEVFY
ncbi:MAG: tRNA pseudouridine(38-40) synthase TruA [Clostridia bacterium]|nr:tRNA pseudouridine(38-40) synthase TruA [Clostridia bacterium]